MLLLTLAAVLLIAVLGGVAHAAELPVLGSQEFRFGLYLLAGSFAVADCVDVLIRVYCRRPPGPSEKTARTSVALDIGSFSPFQRRLHLRPYALLVSVHELGDEVDDFIEAMQPYRDVLWLIDDASSDDTCARLQAAGLHCLRSEVNRKKPGAIRALLAELPNEVQTVIVLDPDCRIHNEPGEEVTHLENLIFEFQRSGHAAMCPRVEIDCGNLLCRLQSLEYAFCFGLGRRSLGDFGILSGIGMYRRDALVRLLDRHSLCVYAEDLENSIRLLSAGESIYYDDRFVVSTAGKETLRGWFSQRVGWHLGFVRVYLGRLRDILGFALTSPMCAYQYVGYMGIFMLLLHPVRLAGIAVLLGSAANGLDMLLGNHWVPDNGFTNPVYLPLVMTKYWLLNLIAIPLACPPGRRLQHLGMAFLYLPYVLLHIVPTTIGYLNWVTLRFLGRRVYQDHYAMEDHFDGRLGQRS